MLLTSLIFSITHASSSLNKQLSLLNESLLKEKIISLNIFCSILIYSRINVRRWRKNLMSRNIDSQ
ncbi:putative inner membrane protein [Salmonella enterica subsp. enterica serovar Typhimurium]|nr:putative inner membrane protein [Salmonella enterica subsp. enterica serovar Typhimurium]